MAGAKATFPDAGTIFLLAALMMLVVLLVAYARGISEEFFVLLGFTLIMLAIGGIQRLRERAEDEGD